MKPIHLTSSFNQGRNAEQYINQKHKKKKRKPSKTKEVVEKTDNKNTSKIPFIDLPQSIDIALPEQLHNHLNSFETILFQLHNKTYIREKLNYIETFIEIYQKETNAIKKKQIMQLFLPLYKKPSHFFIQKKLIHILKDSILEGNKIFGLKCTYRILRSNFKILSIFQIKQHEEESLPYIKLINTTISLLNNEFQLNKKERLWLIFFSLILKIENSIKVNILDDASLMMIYYIIPTIAEVEEKKQKKYYMMIDELIKKRENKRNFYQKIIESIFKKKSLRLINEARNK